MPRSQQAKPLKMLCPVCEKKKPSVSTEISDNLPCIYGELSLDEQWSKITSNSDVHLMLIPNPMLYVDKEGNKRLCTTKIHQECNNSGHAGMEALNIQSPLPGILSPKYEFIDSNEAYDDVREREEGSGPPKWIIEGISCDTEGNCGDSEVCQALWIHYKLLRAQRQAATTHGWSPISAHLSLFQEHGFCAGKNPARLKLATTNGSSWELAPGSVSPLNFDGYNPDTEAWFRLANDSFYMQATSIKDVKEQKKKIASYGSISGLMHPTAMGHLVMALAAIHNL